MPLGKLDLGEVPAHGPSHSVDRLLDDIHFPPTLAKQRLEHCALIAEQAGLEYDHVDDGSNLPCLLGFLRVDKHRGDEAIYLGRAERPLPDPDGHRAQKRQRNAQSAQSATALHL